MDFIRGDHDRYSDHCNGVCSRRVIRVNSEYRAKWVFTAKEHGWLGVGSVMEDQEEETSEKGGIPANHLKRTLAEGRPEMRHHLEMVGREDPIRSQGQGALVRLT